MILAWTGHRPTSLGGYALVNPVKTRVITAITTYLENLLQQTPELKVISGMALGVDQWAAEVCLGLKIPYVAAVPCPSQEMLWHHHSRERYYFLCKHAAEVVYVSEGSYRPYMMDKRNRWMVDRCDRLAAVWDGSPGGTANCVHYAFEKNKPVDRLSW